MRRASKRAESLPIQARISAAVTDLGTKTDAARAAFTAAHEAREAAKAATLTLDLAVRAMDVAGQAIIKQVRAKAAMAGDGVYALAQLPAPAIPSPVGNPGVPTDFGVKLFQDGSLELKWKCSNPRSQGTIYQIYRRATAAGEFTYLGGAGDKRFVDTTLPAGASQVTYQIQGVRSTAVGPFAQFNVNFGTATAGGATAATVAAAASPKLAA